MLKEFISKNLIETSRVRTDPNEHATNDEQAADLVQYFSHHGRNVVKA